MGASRVCSRQSARLAAKCRGWTFKLLAPRRRRLGKVVSRRCMARQGRVLHISVLDSSLLLLLVAPVCQSDSSGPPATRVLRLFMVMLDTASSQFSARGVTSWVHVELLLCARELLCLFHFFLHFFFVLELVAP
jgi:hypothetical protein